MSAKAIATASRKTAPDTGTLVLGTVLTVAALILVPALAARFGLGSAALTGAMRMALMRASSRAINGRSEECGDGDSGFSCH